jgi:uncharacterized tellurite resistance protein B-like protein
MISAIRSFFEQKILSPEEAAGAGPDRSVHLATAALLVEMTRSDFDVHPEERKAVEAAMTELLHLPPEEAAEVLLLAEQQVDDAVSLYEFTSLVHDRFSPQRKLEVVEHLWRVAFADGRLADHELHMMRKVQRLLHIPRKDFVAAKQRARDAAAGGR